MKCNIAISAPIETLVKMKDSLVGNGFKDNCHHKKDTKFLHVIDEGLYFFNHDDTTHQTFFVRNKSAELKVIVMLSIIKKEDMDLTGKTITLDLNS